MYWKRSGDSVIDVVACKYTEVHEVRRYMTNLTGLRSHTSVPAIHKPPRHVPRGLALNLISGRSASDVGSRRRMAISGWSPVVSRKRARAPLSASWTDTGLRCAVVPASPESSSGIQNQGSGSSWPVGRSKNVRNQFSGGCAHEKRARAYRLIVSSP